MNLEKFTTSAQEALMYAQSIAQENRNTEVDVLHLAFALIDNDETVIDILNTIGVNIEQIKNEIKREIEYLPKQLSGTKTGIYISPALNQVLFKGQSYSKTFGDEFISVEHLLIALSEVDSKVKEIFEKYNLFKDRIIKIIQNMRNGERITDREGEKHYKVLEKFTRDLTELARKGQLDPVIGRDEEIRRVIQVLSRRTKNNPVLIGEAGVGKTAIVEGLARRIVADDVPETLKNKRIAHPCWSRFSRGSNRCFKYVKTSTCKRNFKVYRCNNP